MADVGYVKGLLGGLEPETKRRLGDVFTYVLNNLRIGLPGHQARSENLQWIQLNSTTAAVAGTEFSVAHGLGIAPRVAFPCVDLTSVGQQLVPLVVTRPADATRVYLSSASTSAAFTLFVEAR